MKSLHFASTFTAAILAAVGLASPGFADAACSAQPECIDMTILPSATQPSQLLGVDLSVTDGVQNFELDGSPPLQWSSTDSWTIAEWSDTQISPRGQNGRPTIPHVVWIEPGGSPNDLPDDKFDFFTFVDDGNHVTTESGLVEDVSYYDLFNVNGSLHDSFRTCLYGSGDFQDCPVLSMGQTYDVPINYSVGNNITYTTLSVTLNEGVPEPSSWAMMLLGVASFGVAVRRRRYRLARVV